MRGLEIEAVYEGGTLKLEREIPLENGQRIRLTIHPPGGRAQKSFGLLALKGSADDLAAFAEDPELGLEGIHDLPEHS